MDFEENTDSLISEMLLSVFKIMESQKKYTRNKLAKALEISESSLYNYLNNPREHKIPLRTFLRLCSILGISPADAITCRNYRFVNRLTDPASSERRLLDYEQKILPGQHKNVLFPLFSSLSCFPVCLWCFQKKDSISDLTIEYRLIRTGNMISKNQ